jgi:hypothetical protein
LLTLTANLALTAVITLVGALLKKSGGPYFACVVDCHFKQNLHALKYYVDVHFSFYVAGDLELYNECDGFLPSDRVALLQLWDKVSLLHEESKQICSTCIPNIGFEVDPNVMSVKISKAKQSELIDACTAFTV